MVVHRNRKNPLGVILPDDIIVENPADIARSRHPVARFDKRRLMLLTDDVHAKLDALVADKHGRTRNQLPDLVLALAAEGAVERIFRVATAGLSHCHSMTAPGASRPRLPAQADGGRQDAASPGRPTGLRRRGPFKYMYSWRINNCLNPPRSRLRCGIRRGIPALRRGSAAPRRPHQPDQTPWLRAAIETCRARRQSG